MIAIITKYLGPTNCRGSRIRATIPAWGGRKADTIVIQYDDGLSSLDAHYAAANAVADLRSKRLAVELGLEIPRDLFVLKHCHAELETGYAFICGSQVGLENAIELDSERIR